MGSEVLGTLQATPLPALNAKHEAREQTSNDAMVHRRVAPRAISGRVPPRSGQYPRECAEDLSTPRKIFEICVYDCPPFRAVRFSFDLSPHLEDDLATDIDTDIDTDSATAMEAADYSEKSSTHSEERDPGLPPTKLQKQLAKITFFLTRWGVETNGYVCFALCVLQQSLKR